MPASDGGYSFDLSVEDFDKSVLPPHARTPGTDEFAHEVSKYFQKEFAGFSGRARVVVDGKTIRVSWHADRNEPTPLEVIQAKLERGEFEVAIAHLEVLRRYQPNDLVILCNLGMALSDAGRFAEAELHLQHAVEVDPDHVSARIALGVALTRQGKTEDAIAMLRIAVAKEPANPWAHRNLGGCLLKERQLDEAEKSLRRAVELGPADQQAVFGLAQVLHAKGDEVEADGLYVRAIELDATGSVAELARKERTKFAQKSFRTAMPGLERPDAVMYCLSALRKFEKMSNEEVQKIGFEIAMLGQRGLDPNDSSPRYRLRSMQGDYSALHLLCYMYAAFKIIAPDSDIGFDVSKEYSMAKGMHQEEPG